MSLQINIRCIEVRRDLLIVKFTCSSCEIKNYEYQEEEEGIDDTTRWSEDKFVFHPWCFRLVVESAKRGEKLEAAAAKG